MSKGQGPLVLERNVARASSSLTDSSCYHLFLFKKRQHAWLAKDSVWNAHAGSLPLLENGITAEKTHNALRGIDRQREYEITQEAAWQRNYM